MDQFETIRIIMEPYRPLQCNTFFNRRVSFLFSYPSSIEITPLFLPNRVNTIWVVAVSGCPITFLFNHFKFLAVTYLLVMRENIIKVIFN